MSVLEEAAKMLEKHALCDHCLGRQFAMLGYGIENNERGIAVKIALTLEAQEMAFSKDKEGVKVLKVLAVNGFNKAAEDILRKMKKRISGRGVPEKCFLCEDKFKDYDILAKEAVKKLEGYDYTSFLVGTELPVAVEEREDEFKAEFNVGYGEDMRNEFCRIIGKRIVEYTGKTVDYKKPEVVVLVNPFTEKVTLQINPLFIAGHYKKLVRGIPQSKWLCSNCRGRGCEKCNWSGKMYPESVEELIAKPLLELTRGIKASFHGSGREDIDARMLGDGRPFVIEVTKPQKRFLNLKQLERTINSDAGGKVKVSNLRSADKAVVRRLKKAESAQKEYRLIMKFQNRVTADNLLLLKKKLANTLIKQRTPIRVLHRRADLTREKYIYEVKIKKLSPKSAEMKIRCQGGLYVKELVTGDEGRTTPNVSEILQNKAEPVKLDVLRVIVEN